MINWAICSRFASSAACSFLNIAARSAMAIRGQGPESKADRAASMAARAAATSPTGENPISCSVEGLITGSASLTFAQRPSIYRCFRCIKGMACMFFLRLGGACRGIACCENQLRGAQPDYHGRCVGVPGTDRGHDGCVGNAHILDATQPKLRI